MTVRLASSGSVGDRGVGRARVEQDDLARAHDRGGRDAEALLATDGLVHAGRRTRVGGGHEHRSAIYALAVSGFRQIAQMAPDGVLGGPEFRRQFGGNDTSV
jgi:hypothetical protein